MKNASYFSCLALSSVLAWGGAAAETVTVNVTARVMAVYDTGNALDGQIVPGQLFTGSYSYDTNATRIAPAPHVGLYQLQGAMASVRLAFGTVAFESDSSANAEIWLVDSAPGAGWDQFQMRHFGNRLLSNGAVVNMIYFVLEDPNGEMLDGPDLPTTAPDPQVLMQKQILINGALGNSSPYSIAFELESAELVPESTSLP